MATKHIIWSNDPDQFDDNETRQNMVDCERAENVDDITDEDVYEEKRFLIDTYYDDELANLNKTLAGRVLCIANLGLWNGRKSGYRIMGNNLNEVLKAFQGDYCEVYSDGRNIRATDAHHDGTNHYTFRKIREGKNIDNLLAKLYAGTATNRDISVYTRSLAPYVATIYGWKCNLARYPYAAKSAAA